MIAWEKNRENCRLRKACISCFTAVVVGLCVINLKLSLALDTPDLSGYLQAAPWACGPAALRVILAVHGIETKEEEVARLAGTDSSGTTLYDLQQAAKVYGLDAKGERWSWARLSQEQSPTIAYVDKKHYVVVLGIKDGFITLFDPAIGQIRQRKEVFEARWTGEILSVSPYHSGEVLRYLNK